MQYAIKWEDLHSATGKYTKNLCRSKTTQQWSPLIIYVNDYMVVHRRLQCGISSEYSKLAR